MIFEQVKQIVLDRAKRLQLCPAYAGAVAAINFTELIAAAAGIVEWVYQSGVVDDNLLMEFPQDVLNAAGIYVSDSALVNPQGQIYLLKGSYALQAGADIVCSIAVLGEASLTASLAANAYLEVKAYEKTIVNLQLNNGSCAALETNDDSQAILQQNGQSVVHVRANDRSQIQFENSDASFIQLRAFHRSSIVGKLLSTAETDVKTFQSATADVNNDVSFNMLNTDGQSLFNTDGGDLLNTNAPDSLILPNT